jgi:hypothetical protein
MVRIAILKAKKTVKFFIDAVNKIKNDLANNKVAVPDDKEEWIEEFIEESREYIANFKAMIEEYRGKMLTDSSGGSKKVLRRRK